MFTKRPLPRIRPQILEKHDIYDLTGGLNDSANQLVLADNELSDGRNMVLDTDQVWTGRGGIQYLGNFLGPTTSILGLYEYLKTSTQARSEIAVYDTDLFVLSGSTWTAQSQSLTTGKKADFCTGNDLCYFTNGYDSFRKYSGSAWTAMANFPVNAATSSDEPNGVCYFKERIIAWNTTSHPNRVYYSNQSAETIGASNYFDVLEPVVKCIPYEDFFMLVFTENFIYRIDTFIFTGAAYDPNAVKQILTGRGCISQRSVMKIGNYIYYLSRTGIKYTDGTREVNISDGKIRSFFSTINQNYMANTCAGSIDRLYYLSVSTSGTKNDRILIYDTLKKVWYPSIDTHNISSFVTRVTSGVEQLIGGDDNTLGSVYTFNNTGIYDELPNTQYNSGQDTDGAVTASTTVRKAQSFQLSANGTVFSCEVFLKKNSGTTTDLTVRIETNSGSTPSGTLANANATGTITAFSSTTYGWYKVNFTTPVMLMGSTTYWLVLQHATEGSGTSAYYWGFDGSSPTYTNGNYASYASSAWTADATKDLLFRINVETGYQKYLTTKGFFLSDPQKNKKIRKIYVETKSSGAWTMSIGINIDTNLSFTQYPVDLTGSTPIRGSTLIRGSFVRGSSSKVTEFLEPDDVVGKVIKLRYYNDQPSQNFKIYGTVINYQTVNLLR